MAILKKAHSILKRLKRDEAGTAAITWALSLTVILGAIGASIDFAVLSNADARSQTIADNTALAAAIYVKNHGRAPSGEGELTPGNHKASSLDYEYKSFVVGGADGVNVNLVYDDNAKEVTATVTGQTKPLLVQLLTRDNDNLNFSAQAVVSYMNIEDKFPASIALVLDNSGSMQFDDKLPASIFPFTHTWDCQVDEGEWTWVQRRGRWRRVWVSNMVDTTCSETHDHGEKADGAEIRLVGLKNSVLQFQSDLKSRLGEEDDSGRKTLRMGMLPYSSSTIASGTQPMDWGYLDEGDPNPNSTSTVGIRGMSANGGTNSSPPMSDAENWMIAEDAIHTQEAARTQTEDKDPLKFVIFMTDGQNSVGSWTFTAGTSGKWYRFRNGSWQMSPNAASGYTEGTLRRTADVETEQACTRMKAAGVTIFTIGYALEDFGRFRVNGWDNREDDELWTISSDVQTAAYNLISNCASSPEHFIKAADSSELERAFDEIQNAIVEELIRLKS